MFRNARSNLFFLVGIILLIAFVVGMLDLNGVINIRALIGGEGHFIPIDYEKDIKKLCDKMDEEGNYNKEEAEKYQEKLREASNSNKSGQEKVNEMWDVLRGEQFCVNKRCVYFEDSKELNIYMYTCGTDEVEKYNLYDEFKNMQVNMMLNAACSSLNSKGEYKSEKVSCEKFFCTVTYDGAPYTINCNKRDRK